MRTFHIRDSFATLTLAGLTLICVPQANASYITYSAVDSGATSADPHPNSNAAAASFDSAASALGTEKIINFESAPLGSFSTLTVAPGVSISGTDYLGANQTIRNTAIQSPDSLFGYNTTVGGSQFVYVNAGTLTFTFSTPTDAFGAYITGLQLDGETMTFNDGSAQTLTIPNPGNGIGGAEFVGFTDAGHYFSSLTINTPNPSNSSGDFIGVDDVRYVSASTNTPEPAALAPLGLAVLGLGTVYRKRKRNA